jgi:acyl-CoA thioester hydrolase
MTTLTPDVSPVDFAVFRVHSTRWMDDDVYGHLNNVVYYSLFDSAVNGWLIDATGVDIRTLPAIGIVAETACRYFSETAFPDVLQIGIGIEHRGRTSVIYRLAAFREEDGGQLAQKPSAVCRFVHVYVDKESRRPVPIPDRVSKALDRLGEGGTHGPD